MSVHHSNFNKSSISCLCKASGQKRMQLLRSSQAAVECLRCFFPRSASVLSEDVQLCHSTVSGVRPTFLGTGTCFVGFVAKAKHFMIFPYISIDWRRARVTPWIHKNLCKSRLSLKDLEHYLNVQCHFKQRRQTPGSCYYLALSEECRRCPPLWSEHLLARR